jgi:hypothetical protein
MLHTIDNFKTQYHTISAMEVGEIGFLVSAQFAESNFNYERITNYRSGPIDEDATGTLLIKIDRRYTVSQIDGYCLFYKNGSNLYHYQTFATGGINRNDIEPDFFKIASELGNVPINPLLSAAVL